MLLAGYGVNLSQAAEGLAPPSVTLILEQRMEQGQALMDEGELDEALIVFEGILKEHPAYVDAVYQQGVVWVRMNDTVKGIELIERALEMTPENQVYLTALASMYEFSGRMEQARLMNKKIMGLTAIGSSEYRLAERNHDFILASGLARRGDLEGAERMFSELARRYADDFMIHYSHGVALMLKNSFVLAEASFLRAININPNYINIYLSLAKMYEKQGRLGSAYEMLVTVVDLGADGAAVDSARFRIAIIEGQLFLAEGNRAEARAVLALAQGKTPKEPDVLFKLSFLHEQLEDWPWVIVNSEAFLKIVPAQATVQMRLAKAYVNSARLEEAAIEFEKIITSASDSRTRAEAQVLLRRIMATSEGAAIMIRWREKEIVALQQQLLLEPDNIDQLEELSAMFLEQKNWQEARLLLERLRELAPRVARNYTGLALVYDRQGLYREAIEPYLYGISLELSSDLAGSFVPSLQMAVAKAAYADGEFDLAARLFAEILLRQSVNTEARFYAGMIYFQGDQFVEAIDAFQRVLTHIPSHTSARLNLAMSLHRLKREEEAIAAFRDALQFARGDLIGRIQAQMESVEKSIRGFSGGLSYTLSYDSNSNLDDAAPQTEYQTALSPQLIYRYKAKNGLRWRLSTAPVYSSYHRGQYDFLNTNSTVSASVSQGRVTWGSGLSYRVSRGLIDSRRASNSTTIYGEWSGRFMQPVMLRLWRPERALMNTSLRASYTELDSLSSSFFSAFKYSAVASIRQLVAERTVLSMSYRSVLSENMSVSGSDYAFRSQGIDVRLERGVAPGVSVNGSYSLTKVNYLNPDSVSGYTRFRRNHSRAVVAGVSYQFHDALRFFANVSWSENSSNLPVGFVLNAQNVIEGLQSSSLGDYSRVGVSAGMALRL